MPEKIPFRYECCTLWVLLTRTASAIFKARHKKFGEYVHYNQTAALGTVWALDGKATPAMLARHLFLEFHTASELITRLEKKGFITKNKDKKRENVVRLSITEEGRRFCRQVVPADYIRSIMSALDKEQRQQLRAGLNIILEKA